MILLGVFRMTATLSQRNSEAKGSRDQGKRKPLFSLIFRFIKGSWGNWIIPQHLLTIDWCAAEWEQPCRWVYISEQCFWESPWGSNLPSSFPQRSFAMCWRHQKSSVWAWQKPACQFSDNVSPFSVTHSMKPATADCGEILKRLTPLRKTKVFHRNVRSAALRLNPNQIQINKKLFQWKTWEMKENQLKG